MREVWSKGENGKWISREPTCAFCDKVLPHETDFNVTLPRESDSIWAHNYRQHFEFCDFECLQGFVNAITVSTKRRGENMKCPMIDCNGTLKSLKTLSGIRRFCCEKCLTPWNELELEKIGEYLS